METVSIVIHQAFFGEVNRAHSCISQTISDSDLTSFLIQFTDRPAAVPPGVDLMPYLSGSSFSKYYLFTKTFPDAHATRAGMVFTHVLIIQQTDIHSFDNLEDIIDNFLDKVPIDRTVLSPIELKLSSNKKILEKSQPKYVQETISSLINGVSPILFSGPIEDFVRTLQPLWNFPNKDFRKKIKFRASFTPSDIEGINDLTIVSIQKEFLSKWKNHKIILSENRESVEITNPSEELFLGYPDNNLFNSFLNELNISISEISTLVQCDNIYRSYSKIEEINDPDLLRLLIRQLAKISPNPKDGKTIKEKFIQKLEELFASKKDANFKALRNIDWSPFPTAEHKVEGILDTYISTQMSAKNGFEIDHIVELLILSEEDEKKNWWHSKVQSSFKFAITNNSENSFTNVWKICQHSKNALKFILSFITSSQKNENQLRNTIPNEIKEETIKDLRAISKKRKWYLLYADLLLKVGKPSMALEMQLSLEKDLSLEDSLGVTYLADKLSDKELVELTLSLCENKLNALFVNKVIDKKTLLKDIDVKSECWMKIWLLVLEKKQDISFGIEGQEQIIIDSVLDLLINNTVDDLVIKLISKSQYADISNYSKRNKCWDKIPEKYRTSFVAKTSDALFNKFIKGQIALEDVEKVLNDKITSDENITSFLNNYKNNISAVIKVYERFPELKDDFLSTYIGYYTGQMSETEAQLLGEIISMRKYHKSAKSVYEKSKYNASFEVTFTYCQNLVSTNNWWSFWNPFDQGKSIASSASNHKTILIVTATDKETSALNEQAKIHLNQESTPAIKGGHAVKCLGKMNGHEIWHGQCEAGSGGPSGAQAIATDLIDALSPHCVLMPGIAFGLKPDDGQKIGDILVSTHIYTYEKERDGEESIPRADKVPASSKPLSVLRMVKQNWNKANMHFGILMSGEKLVDNPETVAKLLKMQPEAIGGEMEGAGIYAAAHRRKVDWIVFKSIVDWGMKKDNVHQSGSSSLACEVLFEALKIITLE